MKRLSGGKPPLFAVAMEQSDFTTNEIFRTFRSNHTAIKQEDIIKHFSPDISNAIGTEKHGSHSIVAFTKTISTPLILSFIFFCITVCCVLYLSKIIFIQFKAECWRQHSISSMIHEFKRPISIVINIASVIPDYLDKDNIPKVKEYMEIILTEMYNLNSYLERMEQASNTNNRIKLSRTITDTYSFFENIQKKYEEIHMKNKKIDISLKISPEIKTMNVDVFHFSNVIDNLIENAVKYSGKEVKIEIEACKKKNYLTISIKDNGFGISSKDKKYIFDSYFRGTREEIRKQAGFGLGLSYVKSIVEKHDGSIEVNSKEFHGSEFIIYLP